MANMLENYGLDIFNEDEESFEGFVRYNVENGSPIVGYHNVPYIHNKMENAEFFVKTKKGKEGRFEICGFDSHCSNRCVWEMVHAGIDITPDEASEHSHIGIFHGCDGKGGPVPIELITADVLPSFMEDDKITMQVVAMPIKINYYANEEEYVEAQPENKNGEKWLMKNGMMLPVSFLYNHSLERYEPGKYYDSDCYVEFTAVVKEVYHGIVEFNGEKCRAFIRCVVETQYGDLEFAHTLEQVQEEQRKNIKAGSIVNGTCIISGDVAVKEYENGIVKDFEHNLRLLRYSMIEGKPERLASVLDKNAIYESDNYEKPFVGDRTIIDRLAYVHNNRKNKYVSYMATIVEVDSPEVEYPVGTKCFILAEKDSDNYESIVFIDVNDEGMITRIKVSVDRRYHFQKEV